MIVDVAGHYGLTIAMYVPADPPSKASENPVASIVCGAPTVGEHPKRWEVLLCELPLRGA